MAVDNKRADSLAREHTAEAIAVLHEIMITPFAEHKDRIRAAESLLERGSGKAVSAVIQIPLARRQAQEMATMTDDELMDAIRAEPLPRLAAPSQCFNCGHPQCPGDHEVEIEICADVVPTGTIDPLLL